MKVADAIAAFLAQHVRHVFVVSGGANLHILDSISKTTGIELICPQHEQSASFAADAYARLVGLGCAITTSGPGATNLVTGIASAYYDSVACLFICGNQTRERLGEGLNVRQFGFQATPIVDIVRPITKLAHTVMDPSEAVAWLADAICVAKAGRPGPVLIDIPDDVARAEC